MSTSTKQAPEIFSLRTPYLSEGRSDAVIAKTDQITVRLKVYAEGGENALHAHMEEDHAFIILEGEATFYDHEEKPRVVGANQGIMLPAGNFYRFQSTGDTNLVIIRVGTGKPEGHNDRVGPDGEVLPGVSKKNKQVPGVPVPGRYYGDN
jgi:mannose-6-phosphate isomerase-like protein (cupin superfamily)